SRPEPRLGRLIGKPAFLVPRDHLDVQAGARLDCSNDLIAVERSSQRSGAHCGDSHNVASLGFIGHSRDREGRSLERGVDDYAMLLESFPKAGHLRSVDDGAPRPSKAALADEELDRISTDVDHCVAWRFIIDPQSQIAWVAVVHVALQPSCSAVRTILAASSASIVIVRVDLPLATTAGNSHHHQGSREDLLMPGPTPTRPEHQLSTAHCSLTTNTEQGAKRATCSATLPNGGPEGLLAPRDPSTTSLALQRRASSMMAVAGRPCTTRACGRIPGRARNGFASRAHLPAALPSWRMSCLRSSDPIPASEAGWGESAAATAIGRRPGTLQRR